MTDKTFDKYKLVIDEWFVNGFNGVKAYQKIYPKSKDTTASVKFKRLVRIGKIETYINSKKNKAQVKLDTSHTTVLKELQNWAYSDITETLLLSPEQIKELPEEIRRLITRFERQERQIRDKKTGQTLETIVTVKLWFVSKEKAIDMINKHIGFYGEHNYQKNDKLTPEERAIRIAELKSKMNL